MNEVKLIGTVSKRAELLYTNKKGIAKYQFVVDSERLSGTIDSIPVITSNDDVNVGDRVCVKGTYSSFNKITDGKSKLKLDVFAKSVEFFDENSSYVDEDTITISGTICKQPILRKTPFGKTITDLLIAVNRETSDLSDYIPTIAWGPVANKASTLKVGDKITVEGRIQSRIYVKNEQEHTAYEVSISKLTVTNS